MKQYGFVHDPDKRGDEAVSITNKPKRKLDLLPRLVCLFIALLIWLWMVNFNETDVTETMVLKISFVGLESLENDGMMIYGLDKTEITVTVKGSNRDIKKHEPSEYSATVDVSAVDGIGQYTLPLSITIPSDSNVTVVESEPLNLSLMADLSATKTVPFDVLVSNGQDSGLVKYSYQSTYEVKEIEITGPKSIVDTISSGRFNVNGNFVSTSDEMDFSGFPLTFLDKNLSEVNVENTVNYSTEDIGVNVKAIAHKNILLSVKVLGEGGDLVAKPSTDSIEIWGVPSVVRDINNYTIELEKAEIGKTATYNMTSDSLPDGVSVEESIVITISFEEPIS